LAPNGCEAPDLNPWLGATPVPRLLDAASNVAEKNSADSPQDAPSLSAILHLFPPPSGAHRSSNLHPCLSPSLKYFEILEPVNKEVKYMQQTHDNTQHE